MNRQAEDLLESVGGGSLNLKEYVCLLNLVQDPVFLADGQQRILTANAAAERWLGQGRAAGILANLVTTHQRTNWSQWLEAATTGATLSSTWTFEHNDGRTLPAEVTLQFLPNNLLAVVVKPVCVPKPPEGTLEAGDDPPRLAANWVQQFIWTTTAEGIPDYCNAFWQHYTGLSVDEWKQHGWAKALHPDDGPATAAAMSESISQGKPLEMRHRLRQKDGAYRWFLARLVPVQDAPGRISRWVGTAQDIEDLVRMEDSLRRSEELFHDLTRLSPVGLFRTDPLGRCVYVNERWRDMSGLTWEESRGDGWLEALHTEDRVRVMSEWQKAVDAGQPFREEFRLQPRGDETHWVMVEAIVQKDPQGQAIGYVGTVTDITGLKQAQEAMQAEEERFRTIFESAPVAMAILNAAGAFQQVSQRMERLLGFSAEELHQRTLAEIAHPANRDACAKLIQEMQQGTAQAWQFETRLLGNVGQTLWVHATSSAVRDPAGGFLYAILMMEDVTERMTIEDELQKVTQSFRTLAALAPVGIFRTDINHRCTYVNARWAEMTGLTPEAAMDQGWIRILPAELRDRTLEAWSSTVLAGMPYQFEGAIQRLDGATMWVICQALPEKGPQGEVVGCIATLTDLTARKTDEDQQLLLERRLQEAQKLESLAVLAGGVAHDFNNLLTGILGNAALASEGVSPSESIHYHLQQIEKASLRAAELCKQMLAYSGKGRFVVESLALNTVVEDTLQVLKPSIPARIALKLDLTLKLPAVKADATQMRQLIMNLVLNAAEAIGDRTGLVSITTGVLYASRSYFQQTAFAPDLPEGDYVFLEVSDSGSGMSRETQKKIFDPFFSTKFVGRGLGLPAVLGIVRGHKGAIHVYSEAGRGSNFKVLLPCAPRRLEQTLQAPPASPAWRGHGVVLVVDDEPLVRSVASQMMTSFGFEVLTAENGKEATNIFSQKADQIRLVLLDLTMPVMDGVQVFRELRAIKPDARVLLMSGFNEVDAVNRFAGRGLAGFLQKPFKPDLLREKLRTILE